MMNGARTRLEISNQDDENSFTVKRFDHDKISQRTEAVRRGTSTRIDRPPLRTDQFDVDMRGFVNNSFDLDPNESTRLTSFTPTTPMIHIRVKANAKPTDSPVMSRPSPSTPVRSRVIERSREPTQPAREAPFTQIADNVQDDVSDSDSNEENHREALVGPAPMPPTNQQQLPSESTSQIRALMEMINEDLDRFVYTPIPGDFGDLQCRITRDKHGVDKGLHPMYYMHFQRPGDGKKVFILAGRKRRRSATSNYIISTDATDLSRDGERFTGKVRGNMLGTQFTVYDQGLHSKKNIPVEERRRELATIIYETNILGFKGPRKMSVIIPGMTSDHRIVDIRPNNEVDSLIERWKHQTLDNLITLHNKAPIWSDETQSYVLNFRGRVTHPSVKNFQLIHEDELNPYKDNVCLQFGRVSADAFTCDFKYPLCAVQAFGIALSSLDGKFACE